MHGIACSARASHRDRVLMYYRRFKEVRSVGMSVVGDASAQASKFVKVLEEGSRAPVAGALEAEEEEEEEDAKMADAVATLSPRSQV